MVFPEVVPIPTPVITKTIVVPTETAVVPTEIVITKTYTPTEIPTLTPTAEETLFPTETEVVEPTFVIYPTQKCKPEKTERPKRNPIRKTPTPMSTVIPTMVLTDLPTNISTYIPEFTPTLEITKYIIGAWPTVVKPTKPYHEWPTRTPVPTQTYPIPTLEVTKTPYPTATENSNHDTPTPFLTATEGGPRPTETPVRGDQSSISFPSIFTMISDLVNQLFISILL